MEAFSVGIRLSRVDLRRHIPLVLILLAGLLAGTGCGTAEGPPELAGMTRRPTLNVDGATLPQTNPKRSASDNRMAGREDGLMLLYFGYTFCPDVCPATLADLRVALSKLDAADRKRVEVAMVTVDPERDTAAVMNRYVGHFFPDGEFASFVPANDRQLDRAERAFKVAHEYGKRDRKGNYEVAHTAQVFAIADDGEVMVEWPFGTDPDSVAGDIRLLLERIDETKLNEGEES